MAMLNDVIARKFLLYLIVLIMYPWDSIGLPQPLVSNIQSDSQGMRFNQCQEQAIKGHCGFYDCLDKAMVCGGFIHNHTMGSALCSIAHHATTPISHKGLSWTRDTNRCVIHHVAHHSSINSDTWCWRVGDIVKDAFSICASKHNICKILWKDRKALSQLNFLTLIEAARDCPRAEVNKFISWNVMRRLTRDH